MRRLCLAAMGMGRGRDERGVRRGVHIGTADGGASLLCVYIHTLYSVHVACVGQRYDVYVKLTFALRRLFLFADGVW